MRRLIFEHLLYEAEAQDSAELVVCHASLLRHVGYLNTMMSFFIKGHSLLVQKTDGDKLAVENA